MEAKVNFTMVGIFVLLFGISILGFAFWLMKFGSGEDYNYYHIYIEESIAGLSKDSSVKYLGVDAGVVDKIEVNPSNTQQVRITVKLQDDILIKEDMTATLKFYGLTGLAYLEIKGSDTSAKVLETKAGEIPVIKSSPSLYIKLDDSLSMIASKLASVLDKIDILLKEENLEQIENTLSDIQQIIETINQNKQHFVTLLKEGSEIGTVFEELKEMSKTAKNLMRNLDRSLKRGDYNLKEMAEPSIEKLNALLDEVDRLTSKLEHTVETIEQSPSDLLFKSSTPKLGPGEER
ncbi:MCE family protein [bacterium]|nr:MCE family protein [bacterium]MBU1956848.1 MCE family protein [bacterium]